MILLFPLLYKIWIISYNNQQINYILHVIILVYLEKEAVNMALAEVTKFTDNRMTVNDAMDELLSKLDVAIDDMEQGRVQPIDDAWKEIDRIQGGRWTKDMML